MRIKTVIKLAGGVAAVGAATVVLWTGGVANTYGQEATPTAATTPTAAATAVTTPTTAATTPTRAATTPTVVRTATPGGAQLPSTGTGGTGNASPDGATNGIVLALLATGAFVLAGAGATLTVKRRRS